MSPTTVAHSVDGMSPLKFVLGFLPWIAFSFAAQRLAANGVAWAALLAVGCRSCR